MRPYRVVFETTAARQLEKLEKQLARRILARVVWLAQNVGQSRHEALRGELSDAFKLRVGPYRILYRLDPDEKILTVMLIGHRREIYRRR
ncbi:MAG: type II toxin-antitoxin system RelE/ParE family toxin [Chloroflexi bacterium]|nr:type II toxin-antitoxin system RelE/ParE family toxin [Chloroflexota bacterium]